MLSFTENGEELLNLLCKYNIILKNGQVNTRYKAIIIKNNLTFLFSIIDDKIPRESLFFMIYNRIPNVCDSCGAPTKFINPKFINPSENSVFSLLCKNKKCKSIHTSKYMKFFTNNKAWQNKRICNFSTTVKTIKENGITKATEIALKAAVTKRNTYIGDKTVLELQNEKSIQTRIRNGNMIDPIYHTEYQKYAKAVYKFTANQQLNLLKNIEKRGHYNNNGYHLDHIFSIFDGFRFNIPIEIIGDIVNLRFIPAAQNTGKSGKSDLSLTNLFNRYFDYHFLNILPNTFSDFNNIL